jgi:hypothetical protein
VSLIGIWSAIEPGLGITAGSLATLRPLLRAARDRVRSKLSNSSLSGTARFTNNSSMHWSNSNPRQSGTLDMEELNDLDEHFTFSDKMLNTRQEKPNYRNDNTLMVQEQYVSFNVTPQLGQMKTQPKPADLEAGRGSNLRFYEPLSVPAAPLRNIEDETSLNAQTPSSDVSDPTESDRVAKTQRSTWWRRRK